MTKTVADFWRDRLRDASATKKADISDAEQAAREIYQAITRPEPKLVWIQSPNAIDGRLVENERIVFGLIDRLFYQAWYTTPEPDSLVDPLGFDPVRISFRMKNNYQSVLRGLRLRRIRGTNARPHWLRESLNFVTQFDAPVMAFWQYAMQEYPGQSVDLGNAVVKLLQATFGIVAFRNVCLLIERPSAISFDEMNQLSATTTAALRWRDRSSLHAVNGTVVPEAGMEAIRAYRMCDDLLLKQDRQSYLLWWHLNALRNAAERVAMIQILGWDTFYEITPKDRMVHIHRDKYGELWRVVCGNQTLMLLRVTNHSPEPDGSYRRFVIPVDPVLRPLPNPRDPKGQMGAPQQLTALNAVASTFGMTGQHYASVLGEQS